MKKSHEIRQELSALVNSQSAIMNKAKGESRSALDEAEQRSFDDLQAQIEAKKTELRNAEINEENLRNFGGGVSVAGEGVSDGEAREMDSIKKRLNIGAALRMAATGRFEGVEKEVQEIGTNELRAAGKEIGDYSFNLPADMVRSSSQTVSEDSGNYGGALVVNQAPRIVDAFIPKLFIEQLGATVLTGLSGGKLPLPVPANYAFSWYNETEDAASQKATITGPSLDPKRMAAVVLISNRLLSNASVDAQSMVMRNLGNAAARALNDAAINGLGVKDPTGLLSMSGLGAGTSVAATLPTWALVNELKGIIEQNDSTENSLGYLCDPSLLALLETTAKASAQGFIAEKGMIGGYNTVSTSLVKAIAGTPVLHSLIFGDWSQMFVGQWGGIQFVVDPLTAASANSLKVTVNMDADIQVANKKAFAVNSFFKLS